LLLGIGLQIVGGSNLMNELDVIPLTLDEESHNVAMGPNRVP
jgi:hypothetical protein